MSQSKPGGKVGVQTGDLGVDQGSTTVEEQENCCGPMVFANDIDGITESDCNRSCEQPGLLLPEEHGLRFENAIIERQTDSRKRSRRLIPRLPARLRHSYGDLTGWRAGLSWVLGIDVLVLTLTLCLLLVAYFNSHRERMESVITAGSCDRIRTKATWLHLAINIGCTALLSTSAYTMQCLGCPTRQDIDKAHKDGRWLTIGSFSLGNFTLMERKRVLFYVLLAITSVPIHLMANSSVYTTTPSNNYMGFEADESIETVFATKLNSSSDWKAGGFLTSLLTMIPAMKRLENEDCLRIYTPSLQLGYRHLVLVLAPKDDNTSISSCTEVDPFRCIHGMLDWGYDPVMGARHIFDFPTYFNNLEYHIDYCLSEVFDSICQLRCNILIIVVIVICAVFKSGTVACVLWHLHHKQIMATPGDVVASFLERPDSSTNGQCILSDSTVSEMQMEQRSQFSDVRRECNGILRIPAKWDSSSTKSPWIRAVPHSMFATMTLLESALVVGTGIVAGTGFYNQTKGYIGDAYKFADLWLHGFGTMNSTFLLSLRNTRNALNPFRELVIVNVPQLLLSAYYFHYNQAWTYMLTSREWALLGRKRSALRVSKPSGEQRSSYFLTIPWSFAIPLQVASVLLHWLMSQTLFFVRIETSSAVPFVAEERSITDAIGYSPLAALVLCIIFCILLFAYLGFGFGMELNSPIPLACGNSLVISAACHGSPSEFESWLKPVQWGVVDSMEHNGVLHCAISSGPVYSPATLPMEEGPDEHSERTIATFA